MIKYILLLFKSKAFLPHIYSLAHPGHIHVSKLREKKTVRSLKDAFKNTAY